MKGKPRWSTSADFARLLRQCLEEGSTVEIDGLGVFRPSSEGWEFVPNQRPRVFIAYIHEDRELAGRLYSDLAARGLDPWMDQHKLLPGQNWPRAIERAIEMSRFFIACLSTRSVGKRGRFQAELRYALDCTTLSPLDDVYFIPVRLDDCPVPATIQRAFQYVDLFPDWGRGIERIAAITRRQERRP